MKQTLLAVLVALTALLAAAQDAPTTVTKTFDDVADTNVRGNNDANKNKSYEGTTVEVTQSAGFFALFGFEYEIPEGMTVKEAKLHFVTAMANSGEGKVYAYGNDFAENTTYAKDEAFITAALESTSIGDFVLKGHNGKNTSNCGDDYKDLDKWVNSVDITNYIKTVSQSVKRVNFLFDRTGSKGTIYTKESAEATDLPAWMNEKISDKNVLKPYLEVTFVKDMDNVTVKNLPFADTWIRNNNATNTNPTSDTMEVGDWYKVKDDGTTDAGKFYALMKYELPSEIFDTQTYDVKSVNLRLVHKGNQGSRGIGLYAIDPEFEENTTFGQIGDAVNAAVTETPVATYEAKGERGDKAMGDSGITEAFQNVEAWANDIDLTDYVKRLVNAKATNSNQMAFVLAKINQDPSTKKTCKIVTKDVQDDIVNTKITPNVTFPKDEMLPYLTVNYSKRNTTVGIRNVVDDSNAPVEYYNLSGVKVSGDNMAPGIYVRRQGDKTTKILVK